MRKEFKTAYKEMYFLMEDMAYEKARLGGLFDNYEPMNIFLNNLYSQSVEVYSFALKVYYTNYERVENEVKKSFFTPKFKNVITGELLTQYDCELYQVKQEELKRVLA